MPIVSTNDLASYSTTDTVLEVDGETLYFDGTTLQGDGSILVHLRHVDNDKDFSMDVAQVDLNEPMWEVAS